MAISMRISLLTVPIPYVNITTELLSSKLQSLMVLKINDTFLSDGSPSVRNKITLFLFLLDSSEAEAFSSAHAFSKPF